MVVIREATQKDLNIVSSLLKKSEKPSYGFNNNQNVTMVVEDDFQIVGAGIIYISKDIAFIRSIAMKSKNIELRDGLIRALINFAYRRYVEKIFVLANEHKVLYRKIGFTLPTEKQINMFFDKMQVKYHKKDLLLLDVNNFFSSSKC